jgi:hypothetical protein
LRLSLDCDPLRPLRSHLLGHLHLGYRRLLR